MSDPAVLTAYHYLYAGALIIVGLLLLVCLIRTIRGPLTADRIISVNMTGTLTVIIIAILTYTMDEAYLTDVAMIYTMLSFLAVVLLTKIYVGIYRGKHQKKAKEDGANA